VIEECSPLKEGSMLRGFVLGIIFTVVVAAGVGYYFLSSGLMPASADAKPGSIENFIAATSLQATLNKDAPKEPNPVQLTDENLVMGVKLYAANCVICHGTAEGESSASPIAKGESPSPPQLASDGVEDDPEGWTFWKIKNGIRWTGMPSWKGALSDQQIWTLALFLKHMDKLSPEPEATWRGVKMPTETSNQH
jgi:mono/diheme cytochrome c family protein